MQKILKQIVRSLYSFMMRLFSVFDSKYLNDDVSEPKYVSHEKYMGYLLEIANKEGYEVLEIGSREVTGSSSARALFDKANYTGFDIYPGNNVDVVGDAHQLADYFPDKKFDLIYSSAVFEHLAMPWVVAKEISKLLKPEGYVFIETHFSFCSHERPWHFFQFSDQALAVLFSKKLGIRCIDKGMSNPMVGRFSALASRYLRYQPISGLYCHSEFLGQKVGPLELTHWHELKLTDVVGDSMYPEPASLQQKENNNAKV